MINKKIRINVQDQFINSMRKERVPVTVELITGEKLDGLIKSFDNYCVVVEAERLHLIYKHAIANINIDKTIKVGFMAG
ncbi:MAG: RNA chaperone Hfq [Candidatus Lernaella stagnicola]|nr:RNA chaperone Hfq [Candidatus Lernaella stagnicola]